MRRTMESRVRLLWTVLGPAPSSQYGHMPSICSQHRTEAEEATVQGCHLMQLRRRLFLHRQGF